MLAHQMRAAAKEVRAFDTETPACLSFSQTRLLVEPGETNVVLGVNRTGDFRIPTACEYAVRDITSSSASNTVLRTGTISLRAGQGFAEIRLSADMWPPADAERTLQVTLFNPAPNTVILKATATVLISAAATATASQPRLAVRSDSSSGLTLSWPVSFSSYVLECSGELNAPNWIEVKTAPVVKGDQYCVQEATLQRQCFYRLKLR